MTQKYIISGGPGAGKTTLINGLRDQGYSCSAEVSRRLIIEEVNSGSDCLPWLDINCFAAKVLQEMIIDWNSVPVDQLTFFDRGIPDIIAYLKFAQKVVPDVFYLNLDRYNYHQMVFMLPPWEDIYVNDEERWQTFEQSETIYCILKNTYIQAGFDLIEVPRTNLADRISFIRQKIR